MKKISTLLASLILTVSVFAAARPKSTLTIQSVDRSDMKVVIDGRRFEPTNINNAVTIRGIESGVHQVKIYRQRNTGVFNIFGKKYDVVFNSSVSVSPRGNTLISIDRFGRATVNTSRDTRWDNRNNNDRDWSRNNDFDFDHGNRAGDYDNRGGGWGDYDNNYGYDVMSDREFSTVMQSIQKEWLESNKLKSATHIVTTNSLTSAQVKQMVLLFSFESNKLDLAKQAYANTVDKRNYSMINDAFAFNSSIDELARFIRNFR